MDVSQKNMQGLLGPPKSGQGIPSQSNLAGVIHDAPCFLTFMVCSLQQAVSQLVHSVTITLTVQDFTNLESVVKGF